MGVSGRMLLGLEQGVEVPEAAFYIVVCGHLFKAHVCEDFPYLGAHLHTVMQDYLMSFERKRISLQRECSASSAICLCGVTP